MLKAGVDKDKWIFIYERASYIHIKHVSVKLN